MSAPRWTRTEKAAVRRLYPAAPWAEIAAALPGRNVGAIRRRANVLRVARCARYRGGRAVWSWTRAEDRDLARRWTDTSWRGLVERFGRTRDAIRKHAWEIGLRGRWQGYVSINTAAARCGVSPPTLLRALALYAEHHKGLPAHRRSAHPSPSIHLRGAAGRQRRGAVDAVAAELALRFYDAAETLTEAAERLGVHRETLSRAARGAGRPVARYTRRPQRFWTAALARHRALGKRNTRRPA